MSILTKILLGLAFGISAIAIAVLLLYKSVSPIIREINAFRAENNVEPVQVKKEACDLAAIRAKEAETDWSHNGFENRIEELEATGYWWSENLAGDLETKHEVVEAWKESETHREVLLSAMKYACVARYNNTWALEGMEPM